MEIIQNLSGCGLVLAVLSFRVAMPHDLLVNLLIGQLQRW
jgi:hypothetical protein